MQNPKWYCFGNIFKRLKRRKKVEKRKIIEVLLRIFNNEEIQITQTNKSNKLPTHHIKDKIHYHINKNIYSIHNNISKKDNLK